MNRTDEMPIQPTIDWRTLDAIAVFPIPAEGILGRSVVSVELKGAIK